MELKIKPAKLMVALLSLSLSIPSCIPSNQSNQQKTKLPSTTLPTAGGQQAADNSTVQCDDLDETSPLRKVCKDCYDYVSSSQCQSNMNSRDCVDFFNICLVRSLRAGFLCVKTCKDDQTLQPATCTCTEKEQNGTITNDNDLIDVGQVAYGPPAVTAYWPNSVQNTKTELSLCKATTPPISFFIQNRSGAIPDRNTYTSNIQNGSCPMLDPVKLELIEPTSSGYGLASSTLSIKTTGTGSFSTYSYNDFESDAAGPGWSGTSTAVSNGRNGTPSFTKFLGRYSNNNYVKLSLNNKAPGNYMLSFDFYAIDAWTGTQGNHKFNVTLTSTDGDKSVESTIFSNLFTNDFINPQSYLAPPTVSGLDIDDNDDGNEMNDSIYRLNISFSHICPKGSSLCAMTLKFHGSNLNSNTKWGLDNIGVMPIHTCGVKYTFTDSNQLTSTYCMRFNILNTCGLMNSAGTHGCTCFGMPTASGTASYF
ncbi:MAG: hypothetical protein AABZ06_09055, partial [Bdellovibrionota bacterium]